MSGLVFYLTYRSVNVNYFGVGCCDERTSEKMNIEVVIVNYLDENHAKDIFSLMNVYAMDPMGGGKPLSEKVKNNLVIELSKRSYAFSIIAYVEGAPAGLVNCFELFSTFSCRPLINIHDIIVLSDFRGKNISQNLLQRVEEIAISKGCCKLTLEVLEGNQVAKSSYLKFGFSSYQLDPKTGGALFWQKNLPSI